MARIEGGLVDRTRRIAFRFDGRLLHGHPGDTLASALLANDIRLVARSFKYHRPRGILASGSDEPNALVTLRDGTGHMPNTRATMVELHEGLDATSQNRVGSLGFDLLAVNDLLAPFIGAGFYYKTFMWPASFWERLYEPAIRRAAGLGHLSADPDTDRHARGFLHCDLLVIGAGPSGLAAALAAGRAGARVILADEDFRLGGRLLAEGETFDDRTASDWVTEVEAELATLPNVRLMPRCTVFGAYDHGIYGALERDGAAGPLTYWRITARRALLCAGASERHIPFAGNDRPGVMLAGALAAYANRWAALPAGPVAIFTSGDDGHRVAAGFVARGVEVTAVIDPREDARAQADYPLFAGAVVTGTRGRLGLSRIRVTRGGRDQWVSAGLLGVAGGWSPNVHLASHHRGRPVWSESRHAFLPPPDGMPPGMRVAGAAAGEGETGAAMRSGAVAAREALRDLGLTVALPDLPGTKGLQDRRVTLWHVPGPGRAFVDFQNDVTVKDIRIAHDENMRSVEHLKRWTTLGMATDQGRTANVTGLAIMAELTGKSIADTGTTIFRPPYTPVPIAALGAGASGAGFSPVWHTPSHGWAREQGAVFVEAGHWLRARYFPRSGEGHWRDSVDREALAVRAGVGVCDVSTLGKIDVQGRDAAEFLDRVYANRMATLAVGRARYGLMLREDGFLFDDGTCARLGETHFIITTTTANAAAVLRHLQFAHQCLWSALDVRLNPVTAQWAQFAVAGPQSRALLGRIVDGFDLSDASFPFMACAALTICNGVPARLFRISFSGELAYELAVPARYGNALMERIAALGATPYGVEAMDVLRIEKGHATGNELNGQTTAQMLGLERMVSTAKDSIGAIMSRREGLAQDPHILVGLIPENGDGQVIAGAHLFASGAVHDLAHDQGWITSACYSPHLGAPIGLGLLARGQERLGEVITAANPLEGRSDRLRVVAPCFLDPEGERLRG